MHEMIKYNVESKKYGITGEILDWGVVTKLCFSFQGRDVEMAIRPNPLVKVPLEVVGEELMDSYIENLLPSKERKTMLRQSGENLEHFQRRQKFLLSQDFGWLHSRSPYS